MSRDTVLGNTERRGSAFPEEPLPTLRRGATVTLDQAAEIREHQLSVNQAAKRLKPLE